MKKPWILYEKYLKDIENPEIIMYICKSRNIYRILYIYCCLHVKKLVVIELCNSLKLIFYDSQRTKSHNRFMDAVFRWG